MNPRQDVYRGRFRRVLEHIDAHPGDDLSVERLSSVAAFSKFHFHRQFSALLGISVHEYVQLARMKRAVSQLAYHSWRSILEIALDNGYESPEAFARAFRKRFGQAPSAFRSDPSWSAYQQAFQDFSRVRREHMQKTYSPDDVEIIEFPETRIAVAEHRGDPARIGDTIRRFIEWRRRERLPPHVSATYNILYTDPLTTPPEDFRQDTCCATNKPIADNPQGVIAKVIPAGRCAKLRHIGSDDLLRDSVHYLYYAWLPESGEEPRDFPLFAQRVNLYPEVPESEAIIDIFLPLA